MWKENVRCAICCICGATTAPTYLYKAWLGVGTLYHRHHHHSLTTSLTVHDDEPFKSIKFNGYKRIYMTHHVIIFLYLLVVNIGVCYRVMARVTRSYNLLNGPLNGQSIRLCDTAEALHILQQIHTCLTNNWTLHGRWWYSLVATSIAHLRQVLSYPNADVWCTSICNDGLPSHTTTWRIWWDFFFFLLVCYLPHCTLSSDTWILWFAHGNDDGALSCCHHHNTATPHHHSNNFHGKVSDLSQSWTIITICCQKSCTYSSANCMPCQRQQPQQQRKRARERVCAYMHIWHALAVPYWEHIEL